jgi:hypothetical protein
MKREMKAKSKPNNEKSVLEWFWNRWDSVLEHEIEYYLMKRFTEIEFRFFRS